PPHPPSLPPRRSSDLASSGVPPSPLMRFASFAAVVVLPLPLTPTTRITCGRAPSGAGGAVGPSTATSASLTALRTFGTVVARPSDRKSTRLNSSHQII